jgi:hypothetical protein
MKWQAGLGELLISKHPLFTAKVAPSNNSEVPDARSFEPRQCIRKVASKQHFSLMTAPWLRHMQTKQILLGVT